MTSPALLPAPSFLLAMDKASLLNDFGPHALFILGVLFITAWMVIRIRKRSTRNANQPSAREQLERYRTRDAVRGDLEGLMVDIEQLARRLGSQLDAKSQQIESLLAQADQRIAALGGQSPAAATPVDRYEPSTGPADPVASDPPAPDSAPGSASVSDSVPASAAANRAPSPDSAEPEPLVARVHALSDQQRSPADIARELDEPIGKIELILALRRSPS